MDERREPIVTSSGQATVYLGWWLLAKGFPHFRIVASYTKQATEPEEARLEQGDYYMFEVEEPGAVLLVYENGDVGDTRSVIPPFRKVHSVGEVRKDSMSLLDEKMDQLRGFQP